MSFKKTANIVGESFHGLFRKPGMLIAGFVFFVILFLFSTLGGTIAGGFQTTVSNIVWVVVFGIVVLGLASFIFSGMIGLVEGKRKFLENGKRYWRQNFILILIILVLTLVIGRIAHYGAFFIGQLLEFGVTSATIVFVIIYFAGLVGLLIFLTYASFFVVYDNLNILKKNAFDKFILSLVVWIVGSVVLYFALNWSAVIIWTVLALGFIYVKTIDKESITRSKKFVMKNYLETLSVLVGLFVIGFFVDKIPSVVGDLITYVLILPFTVFVLGRMVLSGKKK